MASNPTNQKMQRIELIMRKKRYIIAAPFTLNSTVERHRRRMTK